MDKKNIKLVITDLDNTLYDWFTPWYKSFMVFLNEVSSQKGINEVNLLAEIKQIHEKHGTAEYAFTLLLQELDTLKSYYPDDSQELDKLTHGFYKTKKNILNFTQELWKHYYY